MIIPGKHRIMCWLVEHCAILLEKYQFGKDGRTAFHTLRVKTWRHQMDAFCSVKVHCKFNLQARPWDFKLDGRWGEGYFVGVKWSVGESWTATKDGIFKTSAVRGVGGHRRWDGEGLLHIKCVPWNHSQVIRCSSWRNYYLFCVKND